MIDHIGFAVSNYERAKAFYAKVLAPLGYTLVPPPASASAASRISGSAAKANWRSRCTLRSRRKIAPVSMRSIGQH